MYLLPRLRSILTVRMETRAGVALHVRAVSRNPSKPDFSTTPPIRDERSVHCLDESAETTLDGSLLSLSRLSEAVPDRMGTERVSAMGWRSWNSQFGLPPDAAPSAPLPADGELHRSLAAAPLSVIAIFPAAVNDVIRSDALAQSWACPVPASQMTITLLTSNLPSTRVDGSDVPHSVLPDLRAGAVTVGYGRIGLHPVAHCSCPLLPSDESTNTHSLQIWHPAVSASLSS